MYFSKWHCGIVRGCEPFERREMDRWRDALSMVSSRGDWLAKAVGQVVYAHAFYPRPQPLSQVLFSCDGVGRQTQPGLAGTGEAAALC